MAKSKLENTLFNDEYRFVSDSWILDFLDFSFFRVISMLERRRISEQPIYIVGSSNSSSSSDWLL